MTRVAVVGATGWVGRQLCPRLAAEGFTVRAIVRRPGSAPDGCEERCVSLDDENALAEAFDGCAIVYWLVHSMAAGPSYAELDRGYARSAAAAAARAGCERIIYLGGLGDDQPTLSEHLASRRETGELLGSGPVPVTVLRAGMLIGPGSASFEMTRDLSHRLPVMLTPRWVTNRTQPIHGPDAIEYLVAVARLPQTAGQGYDIGGPDVLTYGEMLRRMARLLGQRPPLIVTVPVLTPELSSRWAGFVTRVPRQVARPLIEGLRVETICRDERITELAPLERTGFDASVREALAATPSA